MSSSNHHPILRSLRILYTFCPLPDYQGLPRRDEPAKIQALLGAASDFLRARPIPPRGLLDTSGLCVSQAAQWRSECRNTDKRRSSAVVEYQSRHYDEPANLAARSIREQLPHQSPMASRCALTNRAYAIFWDCLSGSWMIFPRAAEMPRTRLFCGGRGGRAIKTSGGALGHRCDLCSSRRVSRMLASHQGQRTIVWAEFMTPNASEPRLDCMYVEWTEQHCQSVRGSWIGREWPHLRAARPGMEGCPHRSDGAVQESPDILGFLIPPPL